MESLERKEAEASAGTEEPVKTEDVKTTPSPASNSDRSNNAPSPPPHCSICLSKLVNTSFTDSCLHQFCFTCLLQWSKIKTECPLCKQTFKSIIHNVRSEGDYDQYHVQYNSQVAVAAALEIDITASSRDWIIPDRRFMYRTTNWNPTNNMGIVINSRAVNRNEQIPSIASQVSVDERRNRSNNPVEYRRMIYRRGVWATPLPDSFGRFRQCSAEFYRLNPSEIDRFIPWLNREVQVLLNENQHHIVYVLQIITESLTRVDINSSNFRNMIRPYFGNNTDHFQHEFYNFARSNFDLVGYDQAVVYLQSRGLSNEYIVNAVSPDLFTSSSSSSSDSEVRVIDHVCDFQRLPSSNMPSASSQFLNAPGSSTAAAHGFRNNEPDVLTISSTSSESENECEFVGYVKPRHERTPELIQLLSSDDEATITISELANQSATVLLTDESLNLPSTSNLTTSQLSSSRQTHRNNFNDNTLDFLDSSIESSTDETDSDYNPSRSKVRRGHKSNSSKKSSSKSTRKNLSRKRTKTTRNSRLSRKLNSSVRNRSTSDTCSEERKDTSPVGESSSTRGKRKRYLSKSLDDSSSDYEASSKKNKKIKKSKSTRVNKKRRISKSRSDKHIASDSCTSNSDVNTKKRKKTVKKTNTKSKARQHYESQSSEDENLSDEDYNKPSCSKSTSTIQKKKLYQRNIDSHEYNFSDENKSLMQVTSENKKIRKNLQGDKGINDKTSSNSDHETSSSLVKSLRISNYQQIRNCQSPKMSAEEMPSSSTCNETTEHSVPSTTKINRERRRSYHKESKKSNTRRRSHS